MAAFVATPETLESVGIKPRRKIYLSEKHFWMMIGVAAALHVLSLIVFSFMPENEVVEVPVRSLNIKLGGGEGINPLPLAALPDLESVDVSDKPIKAVSPVPKPPPPASRSGTLSMEKEKPTPAKKEQPKEAPKEAKKPEKEPEPKRIKIEESAERKRPMQNPIPADTSSARIRPPSYVQQSPIIYRAPTVQQPTVVTGQPTKKVRAPAATQQGAMANQGATTSGEGAAKQPGVYEGMKDALEIRKRYEQELSAWLEKYKTYPPAARMLGQHGKPILRLRIDRRGNVQFSTLERGSSYRLIDEAALEMVKKANPFPAPPSNYPAGEQLEFLIPVSFDLQ